MKRLIDIATIQTGVFAKATLNANTLYLQQSDFDADGLMSDALRPTIIIDNMKHLLNEGDLLLASKGDNNMCVIIPDTGRKCVASPSFLVIRLHDKTSILPEYVAWYLNLPTMQKALAAQARGSSIMSISKSSLEDVKIPIPSIERQRRYVELAELQKQEQRLYKVIAAKRKQILDNQMIKNI